MLFFSQIFTSNNLKRYFSSLQCVAYQLECIKIEFIQKIFNDKVDPLYDLFVQ